MAHRSLEGFLGTSFGRQALTVSFKLRFERDPNLLRLPSGVPEGEFFDEQVAIPLSSRGEVEVKGAPCG
jgi:hypothetical protein